MPTFAEVQKRYDPEPTGNPHLRNIGKKISKLPSAFGGFACQAVAAVPVTLCVGASHLLHKCGATSKPKPISEYLVTPRKIGNFIGDAAKLLCKAGSYFASIPGRILGYAAGRIVGAVVGTVIVGLAKLINGVFNTNLKPKKINEYSIGMAHFFKHCGSIAANVAVIMLNPVILGPIIGSGFLFEKTDTYLRNTDGKPQPIPGSLSLAY